MHSFALVAFTALFHCAVAQQIQDIVSETILTVSVGALTYIKWSTTWNQSSLFSNVSPINPIDFKTPGTIGNADVIVDESVVYQTMAGFGATLSKWLAMQ